MTTSDFSEEGEKELRISDVQKSVIDVPARPSSSNPLATFDNSSVLWLLSRYANNITPWGVGWRERDKQLRNFVNQEPYFASALGIMCARNAGFSWKLDGPPRTVNMIQSILETANMGAGWQDFITKLSIDLYTQDNGAFVEVVRQEDSERSPVVAINHLDAARCTHTGNPFAPVIYTDRLGKLHLLKWYQVITLSEMPTPVEGLYGLQYCALSRMFMGADIQKNIETLEYEKTAGRETRVVHLVKGVTTQQINDAITQAQAYTDGQGYTRYQRPVIAGTLDPKADVGVASIDLAGLKESFDEKLNFDHYMNLIAMAFASDYQEFAPLPGGGLGTGGQSEMLHLKSRGKGPGRFMNMIEYMINFKIVPGNMKFVWAEQDLEAEKLEAEVRAIRAQTRRTRIESFEITPELARQIANNEGDLSAEFLAMLGEDDLTVNSVIDSRSQGAFQNTDQGSPVKALSPAVKLVPTANLNPTAKEPTKPQSKP